MAYNARNYAGIIRQGLTHTHAHTHTRTHTHAHTHTHTHTHAHTHTHTHAHTHTHTHTHTPADRTLQSILNAFIWSPYQELWRCGTSGWSEPHPQCQKSQTELTCTTFSVLSLMYLFQVYTLAQSNVRCMYVHICHTLRNLDVCMFVHAVTLINMDSCYRCRNGGMGG